MRGRLSTGGLSLFPCFLERSWVVRKTVERSIEHYANLRALLEKKAERDAGNILKKESMAGDQFRNAVLERSAEIQTETRAAFDKANHKGRRKMMEKIDRFTAIGDIKPGETVEGVTWNQATAASRAFVGAGR